ncbi:MAG: hypothetical protein AAGI15_10935 [Pseudomonadota bacterium]
MMLTVETTRTVSFPARAAAACLVLLAALFASAGAQALEAIRDFEDAPIPDGLKMEQIKKAIIRAGAKRNWIIRESTPGSMEGILNVRKHMVKVAISYDRSSYSITYVDSVNMKYKGGLIHRKYNAWVQNLNTDIQTNLLLE